MDADLLVVGGGASGLFCASLAAARGLRVLLLEAGNKIGRKLDASGGGHANFSNVHISWRNYICHPEQDFCRPVLRKFTTRKFLALIKSWKLPFEERAAGRLFLTTEASGLTAALERDFREHNGKLKVNARVSSICPHGTGFEIATPNGMWTARKVALALGSPAMPSLAGCRDCWNLPARLGHTIRQPIPALTPFLLGNSPFGELFAPLAGIGLPCVLKVKKDGSSLCEVRDQLLFTHRGVSGPAALRASLRWLPDSLLEIDFLPSARVEGLLDLPENAKKTARSLLRQYLPSRLPDVLIPKELASKKIAETSRRERNLIGDCINACRISGAKSAGLEKSEICAGGVAVNEVAAPSMASRLIPGLYLLGEMLDVAGDLGGYNLHWAFASAWCAAEDIGDSLGKNRG